MSIERRYHQRNPHSLAVQIAWRGRRFFAASRDHSSDGMYLSADHVTIPPGNMVELEFSFDGVEWQLPALVIHNNRGGIGVMFRRPQPQFTRPCYEQAPTLPPNTPGAFGNAETF